MFAHSEHLALDAPAGFTAGERGGLTYRSGGHSRANFCAEARRGTGGRLQNREKSKGNGVQQGHRRVRLRNPLPLSYRGSPRRFRLHPPGQNEEVVPHDGQRDREPKVSRRAEEGFSEETPVGHPVPCDDSLSDERSKQGGVIRKDQAAFWSGPQPGDHRLGPREIFRRAVDGCQHIPVAREEHFRVHPGDEIQ